MDVINALLLGLAGSPWIYLAVLIVCLVDGFFPPVPSESMVVGLAALALSTGSPNLPLLIAFAAVGATAGDNIAYAIGRGIGTNRFGWMRRPRVAAGFARARNGLDRRGALLILTARYIPVGRVAVNMTAGATGYSPRRFLLLTLVGGFTWAVYSSLVGVGVAQLFGGQPLFAVIVAIVLAAVIGFLVDFVVRRLTARNSRSPEEAAPPRVPIDTH